MDRMGALFRRLRRRSAPSAPSGADEVRGLDGPDADALARAVALLLAVDQAIDALALLRSRRRPRARASGREALTDLALLRYAIVQFVDCVEAAAAAGLPRPEQVYGPLEGGAAFYRHLRAFRDQLCGPQARLVGETEAVALLRRVGGRPVLVGAAVRTRRPDRLTAAELAQMSAFMGRVRTPWAERVEAMRGALLDRLRACSPADLDGLPPAQPG